MHRVQGGIAPPPHRAPVYGMTASAIGATASATGVTTSATGAGMAAAMSARMSTGVEEATAFTTASTGAGVTKSEIGKIGALVTASSSAYAVMAIIATRPLVISALRIDGESAPSGSKPSTPGR